MSPNSGQEQGGGFAEAGRRLREARTKRGWSLQQVAERIHVAIRYLDAIERGDPTGVPAIVYIRGFVINYVRVLGLDEGAILSLLDDSGTGLPAVNMPVSPTSRSAAREKARVSLIPDWRRNTVIIIAVIVVGVIIGLAIRGISGKMSGKGGDGVPPSPFEGGGTSPAVKSKPERPAAPSSKPAAGLRQFMVGVTALQDCWMQAQVDDGKTSDIELKPGDARWFAGLARVRLFIGNAAGVVVTGPQGGIEMPAKPGRVVHIQVTRNGVERLKMPVSPPPSSTLSR